MNYSAYTSALQEQISVHQGLLNQLADKDYLSLLERTAAERSLQIIIEALIGASKHLNRKLELPARNDAYSSVQQLADNNSIDPKQLPMIKGAIGMRNAIVHDYLNLDWEVIGAVIQAKKYSLLVQVVDRLCKGLKHK